MAHRRQITNYGLNQNKKLSNNDNLSKVEKPISSVYNIYFNKDQLSKKSSNKLPMPKYNSPSSIKRKIPIYQSPFYSPNKIDKRINYKIIFPKNRKYKPISNKGTIEYPSSFITSFKKESLSTVQNNTIYKGIYIRKNRIASPKRCCSEKKFKNVFKNKLGSAHLTLTPNKGEYYYSNINKSNNNKSNKNQNIININLYNEKNNYIANNIINKIYIDKNKKNNNKSIYEKKINNSLNNSLTNINNESVNLTERKTIQRRSNYCLHYNRNNNKQSKGNLISHNNSKRKLNNLPKVQRKSSKNIKDNHYKESLIIKIQSVIRGYLLNKKLDKYLRQYIQINGWIKRIEYIFKKKLFICLKHIRTNKRRNYSFKNIYHSNNNKRNNTPNNVNKEKNAELQIKINELINEKIELQKNYENLKEFVRKYKELEKENKEIKNENEKLKLKNKELLTKLNANKKNIFNYNLNKYKRFSIQNQINLNIISPKRVDLIYRKYNLNKEIKKNNKNDFFTLGTGNDDVEQDEKDELLKICKLKCLLKNKENNIRFILFKSFVKFYCNALHNQNIMSIPIDISNIKSNISSINKRYNHNTETSNNLFNCMSIKTLSDNSSIFTERKSQNMQIENKLVTSNFLIEDENKNK